MDVQLADQIGQVHNQDCIAGMNSLPAGCIDLVFADPPFNIGYKYDVYEDKMAAEDYLRWSNEWMSAVHRVLKPDGTFWLAIGDDFAAELKVEARKIGFHCRSWVIWYYTFGVNCKNKFTRSHTHLFHFVKDTQSFTFRADDLENRVPSARMLVYNDKRAKGNGRLPDDTWIIPPAESADQIDVWSFGADPEAMKTFALRPQELESRFDAREDTWYVPRVAGTFKERAGFHGCQMPEQLLGRIIRVSSEEGEVVLDPFSGSASTLVTAKKMGRQHLGFEMSTDYAEAGRARLNATRLGDRLDGSPEPTMEAFERSKVAKTSRRTASKLFAEDSAKDVEQQRAENVRAQLEAGVVSAFESTHDGRSVNTMLVDPDRNQKFVDACCQMGLPGAAVVWNRVLLQISKRPGNPLPEADCGISLDFKECEPFVFASEIAWKTLCDEKRVSSLDDILCDPILASEFDELAARLAPEFSSFQYRAGAILLRQAAANARAEGNVLSLAMLESIGRKLPAIRDALRDLPADPGVYVIQQQQETVYVGTALSIRDRLDQLFYPRKNSILPGKLDKVTVQYYRTGDSPREMLGWVSCFLSQTANLPRYNIPDFRAGGDSSAS